MRKKVTTVFVLQVTITTSYRSFLFLVLQYSVKSMIFKVIRSTHFFPTTLVWLYHLFELQLVAFVTLCIPSVVLFTAS